MNHALEALSSLGGVASTAALLDRGVDANAVRRSVAHGDMLRVRNGWVASPTAAPDVVAAVRVGGALSCTSSLRRRDVWVLGDRLLHVRTNRAARHRVSPADGRSPLREGRHGVRVHPTITSSLPRAVVAAVDDIPQSVLHAAHCLDRFAAVAALDSVLNLKLLSEHALADLLAPQIDRVAGLLDLVDHRAQSGTESICRVRLRSAHIIARPQVRIGGVGHVDLLVGDRLVIELDSREHHSTSEGYAEDRRRDLELARLGYLVLRLAYAQALYHWEGVLAAVRGIIARGEHRWNGRHRRAGLVVPVETYL